MRWLYLWTLVIALPCYLAAQSFENLNVTPQGNKVVITYDLLGPGQDQTYSVEIYGSHNNFTTPIRLATGAVGKGQKSGTRKIIEWDILSELKSFSGEIVFELRGQPDITQLGFRNPVAGTSVKRGKITNVQWRGGAGQDKVRLELFQSGQLISSLGEKTNNGSFAWDLPKDLKTGKGFTLRLTAGAETAVSGEFTVKRKVSTLVKLSPLLLVAVIIPFLKPPSPPEDDLPLAPGPN